MCGIAGAYFFHEAPPLREPLLQMANALCHRGPDAEGIHVSRNAGLAHRRLKIIDLSDAASQPMKDESSRYHVMFNGEIYNFRELRRSLEKDYQFFSQSDTEVILRLFQNDGIESWKQLNGMFAIALLDEQKDELHLARDHAGIKPLYYYRDAEKFLFASEIKALLCSGWIRPELDIEALSLYLQLGYFPAPYTAYKKIRKVLPGHFVTVHRGGLEFQPFWSIRSHLANSDVVKEPEDRLDLLLKTSVEHQMISDVPVGAFLSGGIDSSLIVAMMDKVSQQQVKTFTAGFAKMGYYDERPFARKIADLFSTEHHEFIIEQGVEEIVPKLIRAFDEPFADSSAIPTFCLAQLARQHVTVALSGTGGDEIFGGYRKYVAAQWASLYNSLPQSVKSGIQKTVGLLPASRKTLWQERALLLQRFASLTSNLPADLQLNRVFSPEEARLLLDAEAKRIDFQSIDATVAENMMLFDYEFYLPEDLLVKEDRCTMAFGLEARVPYLDRPLIEFMTRVPIGQKVSHSSTKKLFKRVAARYLPDWVVRRPKHGFGSPVAEWLRTDLRSMLNDLLFSSSSLLRSSFIRQSYDEHQKGVADHSRRLWTVLMLELWHRAQAPRLEKS